MSGDTENRPPEGRYVAWNGREYPWPPPAGWERRSDGRFWPVESGGITVPSAGGFGPQNSQPTFGPGSVYAPAESLPIPRPSDRVGPRPFRRYSIAALLLGAVGYVSVLQFMNLDILGFAVQQQDFVPGLDNNDDDFFPDFAPVGEERELSPQTIDDLLNINSCTNGGDGARLEGEVANPLDGDREYSITVRFWVGEERQLDGFSEVVVPPGVSSPFFAVSPSPSVDGAIRCEFGSVFRFIPE